MGSTLSEGARAIFEAANYATLATLNQDGSPQTSVLWTKLDGGDVLLSTVVGRKKEKNLRHDPRVSLSIFDQANPYNYVEVRGVATLDVRGGAELINELSVKYTGQEYSNDGPDDVRVVVRITPDKVTGTAG